MLRLLADCDWTTPALAAIAVVAAAASAASAPSLASLLPPAPAVVAFAAIVGVVSAVAASAAWLRLERRRWRQGRQLLSDGRLVGREPKKKLERQTSADYEGWRRYVGERRPGAACVRDCPQNPFRFEETRLRQKALDEMASTKVAHFTWNIPRCRGIETTLSLESSDFKDSSMEGVAWRCRLQRDSSGHRLLVGLKVAQLDAVAHPEGRLFAEVCCLCEGAMKTTFCSMYPGVYELLLSLDAGNLVASRISLTFILTVYNRIVVSQLPSLPARCQTDSSGRYVSCHSLGISWSTDDWDQCSWETGLAMFSPLFSLSALPELLWQVHVYPGSDEPETAGLLSFFVKLVDSPADDAMKPVEVDFRLTVNGEEFFDTESFMRSSAHGFRDTRRAAEMEGKQLDVKCSLRVKIPLFT